jgi:hypothetical protein
MVKIVFTLITLGVGLFIGSSIAASASSVESVENILLTTDPAKQAKIESLIDHMKAVTQDELAHGTTEELRGETVFSGESSEKMKALQDSTLDQINDLAARPVQDRQKAVNTIKAFATVADGNESVTVDHYETFGVNPYDNDRPVEFYIIGPMHYVVDVATNNVVQFGPRALKDGESPQQFNELSVLNHEELRDRAQALVSELSTTPLSTLTLKTTVKEGATTKRYFFRWEDNNQTLESGVHPFVQIGLSPAGDVVSYTNILGL